VLVLHAHVGTREWDQEVPTDAAELEYAPKLMRLAGLALLDTPLARLTMVDGFLVIDEPLFRDSD
jgi:hypothetical protein